MEKSKLLEERIKRANVLLKELGYKISGENKVSEAYTCEIESRKYFIGSLLIEYDCKFMEISYSYSFSRSMFNLLKKNLENLMKICYEFGCYYNIIKTKHDIIFTVFTKEYFTGLNYYALKDNLKDFKRCTEMIADLIETEIYNKAGRGGFDENT